MIQMIHPGYPVKKIILSRLQTNLLVLDRDQELHSFLESRVKSRYVKRKIMGEVIIVCKKGVKGKISKSIDELF